MFRSLKKKLEQEDSEHYKKGGYHPVEIGDLFENRYLVTKKIGWGVFSTVWLCKDEIQNIYVALKISKSARYYTDAAQSEVNILQDIKSVEKSPDLPLSISEKSYIVSLLDTFTHRGPNGRHVCLVFEILGMNLLEVSKIYEFQGIPIDICKSFFIQILKSLDFLHRVCEIIHTDLKLENILLKLTPIQVSELLEYGQVYTQLRRRVERIEEIPRLFGRSLSEANIKKFTKRNDRIENLNEPLWKKAKDDEIYFNPKLEIKIVDLGCAVYASGTCMNEIQTREYRSPEVILGYKYSTLTDMWSFGCIAFEMLTGEELFTPNKGNGFSEDDDHLAAIWELIGEFPIEWAQETLRAWKFFLNDRLRNVPELEFYPLFDMLVERYGFKVNLAEEICRFLLPCLQIIPENRISALECLNNSWLLKR